MHPDDHDLIAYDARNKLNGLSFHSDSSHSPYDPRHHAVAPLLPHPAPQTNSYHDPQSNYVHTHQMLPPPSHYGYELTPPHDTGKRKRSGSDGEGDDNRHIDHTFGSREPPPALSIDGSTVTDQSDTSLFASHADLSPSLPPSAHGYAPPISHPVPQQHHHHRLPAQLLSVHDTSPTTSGGPPSVVGQPGMPEPAPRPRGPKLKFTPEEDALLLSRLQRALSDYEHDKWRIIAGKVGNGFTPAACRERAAHFQPYEGVEMLRQGHDIQRSQDSQDVDAQASIHSDDTL
ncbi:hypothetical protein F1880_000575 [Penicillium rolfsii]|nr:hypothetical protein F1880_000575 [Penicillium rolfsii]